MAQNLASKRKLYRLPLLGVEARLADRSFTKFHASASTGRETSLWGPAGRGALRCREGAGVFVSPRAALWSQSASSRLRGVCGDAHGLEEASGREGGQRVRGSTPCRETEARGFLWVRLGEDRRGQGARFAPGHNPLPCWAGPWAGAGSLVHPLPESFLPHQVQPSRSCGPALGSVSPCKSKKINPDDAQCHHRHCSPDPQKCAAFALQHLQGVQGKLRKGGISGRPCLEMR